MSFFNSIIGAMGQVSGFFYDLYSETSGWVGPFYYISTFFYWLSSIFADLSWYFSYFYDWAYDVWDKVSRIFTWENIWSLIQQYAGPLLNILKGLWDWWRSIWDEIGTWWSAVQYTVREWIDAAVGGLRDIAGAWSDFWNNLWPQLTRSFNSLKSAWDNFWNYTFPNLVDFTWLTTWWNGRLLDVRNLINTAVRDVGGLAEGWLDMRSIVVTFFQDPLEFIWSKFADWFLGPEG